jgi:hypothetical protein
MISRKMAALVAASLITSSSAAVAQSAQPLSLTNSPMVQRASLSLHNRSDLDRRGYGIYIVGAIVLGLAAWGIYELVKSKSP